MADKDIYYGFEHINPHLYNQKESISAPELSYVDLNEAILCPQQNGSRMLLNQQFSIGSVDSELKFNSEPFDASIFFS